MDELSAIVHVVVSQLVEITFSMNKIELTAAGNRYCTYLNTKNYQHGAIIQLFCNLGESLMGSSFIC